MNKTVRALIIQLQWQHNELIQQLLSMEQQFSCLEHELHECQKTISQACVVSTSMLKKPLVPEQELAREHFLLRQQQQHNELNAEKTRLLAQQTRLNSQKIALGIKLKTLEKYHDNQLKNAQQQQHINQQKCSDEWVLQQWSNA